MRSLRLAITVGALAVVAGAVTASAQATEESGAGLAGQEDAVTVSRDARGRVHVVGVKPGREIPTPRSVAPNAGPAGAARGHLDNFASLFGIKDPAGELEQVRTLRRPGGGSVVRFQQRVAGLPVIGGDVAVAVDRDGGLLTIVGEIGAAPAGPRRAEVSASAAARAAVAATAKATGLAPGELSAAHPELAIYDPTLIGAPDPLGARLVWRTTVRAEQNAELNRYVLIDATTGAVALSFDQTPHAKVRKVCDFVNQRKSSWICPQTGVPVIRGEGGAPTGTTDVDNAYDITGAVYDFYANVLGRDSIDDNGRALVSSVRFCFPKPTACPYPNAFWETASQQMVFGAGYASADDVVAHELTHGVTEHTSGLLYYFQSGAINESMSDVLGELVDQQYATGSDAPADKWQVGEDLPEGELRSMSNPPAFGQPDRMTSSLWTSDPFDQAFDAGGVHTNSGVGNKAAYLMTDGGTFNGQTVTGIGGTKVAHIWYATDQLLPSGADYADLYVVIQQACANLAKIGKAGIIAANCAEVKKALDAVEMSKPANEPAIPQARKCPSGYVNLDKFTDNFNRSVGGSLGSAWAESGAASINGDFRPSAAAGNALFIPEPAETANNGAGVSRYASTSSYRALSSTYTTYLHFDHAYSLDWDPRFDPDRYFDGGRVEVDVYGDGKGWLVPSSTAWTNGPNRTLATSNPVLPGVKTFSGESRGWTSSKLSLGAYKGKKIRFRFRLGTDGFAAVSSAYGWWIDNVRLYQCSIPPTAPTSVVANGYAGAAKISWAAASSNGGPAVSKYVVYLSRVGESSYINRVELAATARSYRFTKDSAGTGLSYYGVSYKVAVQAKNAQGAYGPAVGKTLIGTMLTRSPASASISPGQSVVIIGKLTRADTGEPLGNVTVQLRYGKPGSSPATYVVGASVKTAADGTYRFDVSPATSTDYRTYYSTGSTSYMGTRAPGPTKITVQ